VPKMRLERRANGRPLVRRKRPQLSYGLPGEADLEAHLAIM